MGSRRGARKGMMILQRRYGAEKAIEHMTVALDVAGARIRRGMNGEKRDYARRYYIVGTNLFGSTS